MLHARAVMAGEVAKPFTSVVTGAEVTPPANVTPVPAGGRVKVTLAPLTGVAGHVGYRCHEHISKRWVKI